MIGNKKRNNLIKINNDLVSEDIYIYSFKIAPRGQALTFVTQTAFARKNMSSSVFF